MYRGIGDYETTMQEVSNNGSSIKDQTLGKRAMLLLHHGKRRRHVHTTRPPMPRYQSPMAGERPTTYSMQMVLGWRASDGKGIGSHHQTTAGESRTPSARYG